MSGQQFTCKPKLIMLINEVTCTYFAEEIAMER